MRNWLTEDTFDYIREFIPIVCADIVYVYDSQVLLIKRNDPNNYPFNCWAVVGGRILRDEPLRKAVKRLMHREVGIRLRREKVIICGTQECIKPIQHSVSIIVRVNSKARKKPKMRLDNTSSAYKWVDIDKTDLKGFYGDALKKALKIR